MFLNIQGFIQEILLGGVSLFLSEYLEGGLFYENNCHYEF